MLQPMNWENEARRIVRAELVRRGITYKGLAARLVAIGVKETERSIANKMSEDFLVRVRTPVPTGGRRKIHDGGDRSRQIDGKAEGLNGLRRLCWLNKPTSAKCFLVGPACPNASAWRLPSVGIQVSTHTHD